MSRMRRSNLLVIAFAATALLSSCGGSQEATPAGWDGPDETFRVNLNKKTDPPKTLNRGYTQWGWGPVRQNGETVGRAWVDCKRLARLQWLCTAVLHLKQGTVIALDATPFSSDVVDLRLIAGTGRYRNPDGWLSVAYFPGADDRFTWHLHHRLPPSGE